MANDFTYDNKTVTTPGPIQPSIKNAPADARTRVATKSDIGSIPAPYVGMIITVLDDETNNHEMTDYKVKSLKADHLNVSDSVIDEVVRYSTYLGVTSGGVDLSGYATKDDLETKADTSHTHTISDITNLDLSNIDANSLNGKKFSEPMTKEDYDALQDTDPNMIYLIDDDTAIEGVPTYTSNDANKVLAVNSNGDALAWVDAPSGSGSGLTTEQTQQLTVAYNHSQSAHVSSNDIPTKVSQLDNDSQYVTTTELNEAISGIGAGGGGSTYDDTELRNSKFDDVALSNNQLSFKANGNVKRTISLPTTSSDGTAISDSDISSTSTWSSEKINLTTKNASTLNGVIDNGNLNLFNKDAATNGHFNINTSTNTVSGTFGGTTHAMSDLIPVCNGLTLLFSYQYCEVATLNKNKEYINGYKDLASITINSSDIYYIKVAFNIGAATKDNFMVAIDKLPNEYVAYNGEFKYNFSSVLWDFDSVDSLITDKKLDNEIYGTEVKLPKIITSTQTPTAILGNNTRHFTIFTFDLTDIKSGIQNGELLYYDIEVTETNSSVLDGMDIWMNYSATNTPSISVVKSASLGSFKSGAPNRYKGSCNCGFSSTGNNYLNVCFKANISDALGTHSVTTKWYKPSFTLGGINLMKYLVKFTNANPPETNPYEVEYFNDYSYVRNSDMYKYVDDVKSEIDSSTTKKFDTVYSIINNIEAGTGGSGGSAASKWQGKKVTFFGDSIVGQANDYEYGFINKLKTSKLFGEVVVHGTPSSTLIKKSDSDTLSFSYRYASIPTDSDLIVIHGGINDWTTELGTIGEKDSTDSKTLYGALNNMLRGIQQNFPQAHKLFVTPVRPSTTFNKNAWGINFLQFSEIIAERCKYYAIPLLDFTNEGYDSSIDTVRAMYTDGGVHPNEAGHQYFYELIGARIELI